MARLLVLLALVSFQKLTEGACSLKTMGLCNEHFSNSVCHLIVYRFWPSSDKSKLDNSPASQKSNTSSATDRGSHQEMNADCKCRVQADTNVTITIMWVLEAGAAPTGTFATDPSDNCSGAMDNMTRVAKYWKNSKAEELSLLLQGSCVYNFGIRDETVPYILLLMLHGQMTVTCPDEAMTQKELQGYGLIMLIAGVLLVVIAAFSFMILCIVCKRRRPGGRKLEEKSNDLELTLLSQDTYEYIDPTVAHKKSAIEKDPPSNVSMVSAASSKSRKSKDEEDKLLSLRSSGRTLSFVLKAKSSQGKIKAVVNGHNEESAYKEEEDSSSDAQPDYDEVQEMPSPEGKINFKLFTPNLLGMDAGAHVAMIRPTPKTKNPQINPNEAKIRAQTMTKLPTPPSSKKTDDVVDKSRTMQNVYTERPARKFSEETKDKSQIFQYSRLNSPGRSQSYDLGKLDMYDSFASVEAHRSQTAGVLENNTSKFVFHNSILYMQSAPEHENCEHLAVADMRRISDNLEDDDPEANHIYEAFENSVLESPISRRSPVVIVDCRNRPSSYNSDKDETDPYAVASDVPTLEHSRSKHGAEDKETGQGDEALYTEANDISDNGDNLSEVSNVSDTGSDECDYETFQKFEHNIGHQNSVSRNTIVLFNDVSDNSNRDPDTTPSPLLPMNSRRKELDPKDAPKAQLVSEKEPHVSRTISHTNAPEDTDDSETVTILDNVLYEPLTQSHITNTAGQSEEQIQLVQGEKDQLRPSGNHHPAPQNLQNDRSGQPAVLSMDIDVRL